MQETVCGFANGRLDGGTSGCHHDGNYGRSVDHVALCHLIFHLPCMAGCAVVHDQQVISYHLTLLFCRENLKETG